MLTCLELLDNICGLETVLVNKICVSIHLCLKMEASAHLKADCCQDEVDFDLCTSVWFIVFF